MEALFLRVVWISLTCSAVLIPLLVGKGWLRQHVRAKALYVVWLILALRLVVPVDLSLPEPAVTVEAPSYQVALPARTPSANLPAGAQIEEPSAVAGQTAPEAASAVRTIPVTALLSALWLICDLVWAGLLARVWGDGKGPVLGVLLGIAVAFTGWTEMLPIIVWPIGNLALAVLSALVPKGAEEIVVEGE